MIVNAGREYRTQRMFISSTSERGEEEEDEEEKNQEKKRQKERDIGEIILPLSDVRVSVYVCDDG